MQKNYSYDSFKMTEYISIVDNTGRKTDTDCILHEMAKSKMHEHNMLSVSRFSLMILQLISSH